MVYDYPKNNSNEHVQTTDESRTTALMKATFRKLYYYT